jgi:hypothetical protein
VALLDVLSRNLRAGRPGIGRLEPKDVPASLDDQNADLALERLHATSAGHYTGDRVQVDSGSSPRGWHRRGALGDDRRVPIAIRLAADSAAERSTRADLEGILAAYDLTPWTFTTDVLIDAATRIPHSHPVLTLTTRDRGDQLLAAYLHEQLHWHASRHFDAVRGLIGGVLATRYESVPVGFPDGCRDEFSTYLHLFVCWQELDALRHVLGVEAAEELVRQCARVGHYRWVYATVLDDFADLAAVYGPRGLRIDPSGHRTSSP